MKQFFLVLVTIVAAPLTRADDFEHTCAKVVENYAAVVFATYSDSLAEGKKLQVAIDSFLEAPSEELLETTKKQWIVARQPYLQSEAFRFYAGPIDDDDGPEAMLNGWPMDESYVDYVVGSEKTGIIGDAKMFPEITPEILASLNEKEGETIITCGYHAIEFLLWGQDLSETGPGERPFTDYTTRANADRRSAYLKACASLLVSHLGGLVGEWAPDQKKNYRAKFVSESPRESVRNIIYGLKTLTGVEFGGERLLVPWDTQSEEDEHSCFSDTTHLDVLYDSLGIMNVFRGTYGTEVEGVGVEKIAALLDSEVSVELKSNIEAMMLNAKNFPKPFDQAVMGERESPDRKKILRMVEILEDQSVLWSKLEQALLAR